MGHKNISYDLIQITHRVRDLTTGEVMPLPVEVGSICRHIGPETIIKDGYIIVQPIRPAVDVSFPLERWEYEWVAKCPVCGEPMKQATYYEEGHVLAEYYYNCPNNCYHHEFSYGGYKTVVWQAEMDWAWNTAEAERQGIEVLADALIAQQRRHLYE